MKDLFDILGISAREDSYTDLIVHLFESDVKNDFRKSFCSFINDDKFNLQLTSDLTLKSRESYSIEQDKNLGKRGKVLPDMVLLSKSQNKAVVFENKIFSNEGHKQTLAYSSKQFLTSLCDKHELDLENLRVKYFYVTIHGEHPESSKFVPLRWSDLVIHTLQGVEVDEMSKQLVMDLSHRAKMFNEFLAKPLNREETLMEQLQYVDKWVTPKTIVKRFMKEIEAEIGTKFPEMNISISSNNSNSPSILVLFSNPKWERNNVWENNDFDYLSNSRNIHIEFTLDLLSWKSSIMVHYETLPYLPESFFRYKFGREPYTSFRENREKFKKVFVANLDESTYWRVANTKLAIAKTKQKKISNMRYIDFKERVMGLLDEIYDVITKSIEDTNNESRRD